MHTAKMDFEQFVGLCGRSLFAEEHKGDLDAAWDYLKSVQYDTLELNDRAEYLRSSSIYAILVGNFANAYEHLGALHELLPQLPQEWGLRYTNYKVLADYTRRFPPALRFYHERGLPLNAVMVSDIIGPSDISVSFMANIQKYMPTGVPRDQGLSRILNATQWVSVHIRDLTAQFHPLSPSHRRHQPGSNAASNIAQRVDGLLKFRAVAEANGATSIAAYLTRLVVEMHIACQSEEEGIMLDDLYRRCERVGDYAGMANAKLLEGDSILCAPFTSPLAMNLIVIDTSTVIGDHELWGPIEHDLKFDYSAEVKQCYESALELFGKGSCKRGQAMVLLRQAGCLHCIARFRRSVNKQYLDILGEAEIKLQKARELFGRDEANSQLVKVHQMMLCISKGDTQGVKTAAREIGTWCAGAKNEFLAHFIGLFLLRFGNEEWFRYSNMDTAMQAWECAYEVLKPINDILPLFQSVVSRASVQQSWFNAAAARLLIEEALTMVDDVREYFRVKISSVPKTEQGKLDWRFLVTIKGTLFWTFTRYVGRVHFRDEDLNSFHEWQARYKDWLETDDDLRAWLEIIETAENNLHGVKAELALAKGNFKSIWQKALMDDDASKRYRSAEIGFRRLLDEGDVLGAEALFRRYLDETEHQGKAHMRDLYRVLACHRIGDRVKAKEILDSVTDDELFEGHLEAYRQGIAIRSSLSLRAQNALSFSIFGCDMDRGRRVIQMIIEMNPTFFDLVLDNALDYSIRISHYAALMKDLQPEISFTMLLRARENIETRRKQTSDLDARVWSSISSYSTEVYIDLARICLTAESSPLPLSVLSGYELDHFEGMSWNDHALLFVEQSRARAVLESLQTQSTQMLGLSGAPRPAKLSEAVHKRRLLRSLLSLKTLSPDQKEEVAQLQDKIKVLEEDGKLSSATTFIETVNSTIEPKLLYQSIDRDAVVIEATFANRGLVAFAVTSDGIQSTYQSSTSNADIRKPVMRAMQIMREMNGYIGEQEESHKRTLNELCNEVSEALLVPFTDIIRTKSHVIFSVSDPLTAFPFSVLPFDNKPLVMTAVVSQVPSLTVHYYLSQRKSASASPTVSVLAKAPIEEPYSSTTRGGEEVNLHMAGIEAVNIARMFATWPIEASHLSRKEFQQYVEGGSLIMHIGTHGDINPRNPLLSSISIGHGQEFRVVDMSAIHSNVNLLVFAACLSGVGKATIGSEVLGFSHVVLSTGCQAYIGSLWKVSDFGSMLIMTLFYRHLKENPQWAVAAALRAAQLDLLKLDTEKAGILLDQMLENWTSSDVTGQHPADFVPDAEFLLLTLKMILGQLDWSSPFYWAPFTLVGYGGLRFVHEAEAEQIREDQSI